MIDRLLRFRIKKALGDYPALMLTGARQCGKTTLARSLGSHHFDLEQESEKLRLDLEWNALMEQKTLVILDEAQCYPEVFNRLRGSIDSDRKRTGRFLLLGSVSLGLVGHVSESLAGRAALLTLSPFSFKEVLPTDNPPTKDENRLWLCGGFPDGGILKPSRFPDWHDNYLTLLTQRDFPIWGLPCPPQATMKLMKMLAHIHGGLWNASKIGGSMGLNYKTVNGYLDFLENTLLVRRLQPFHANIGKRLVKSPKVYWRDTGILHSLLNINRFQELIAHPQVGASWEGFVIENILITLAYSQRSFEAYFFRTSDGHELDLIADFGQERWAIEIKLTSRPGSNDFASLKKTASLVGASKLVLISRVKQSVEGPDALSCNLADFLDVIRPSRAYPKRPRS